MNRKDFLKHRIRKYLHRKDLKSLADEYLPLSSDYFTNPKLYTDKDAILGEINNFNVIENNYDAILLKVDGYLA